MVMACCWTEVLTGLYLDQEMINERYNETNWFIPRWKKKYPQSLSSFNGYATKMPKFLCSCFLLTIPLTTDWLLFCFVFCSSDMVNTLTSQKSIFPCFMYVNYSSDVTSIAAVAMRIVLILQQSWFKVISYIFTEEKSGLQVLIILVKIVCDTLPRNAVNLHQRLIFLLIIF